MLRTCDVIDDQPLINPRPALVSKVPHRASDDDTS
jgi:hypothetical protein